MEAKIAIGIGGINYNLKLGIGLRLGAGDRATVGVAAEAAEEAVRVLNTYTALGTKLNLSGKASGEKGSSSASSSTSSASELCPDSFRRRGPGKARHRRYAPSESLRDRA